MSTVPLPANPSQTQNVLANESKGITQSQPKIEEKEPDAIEIQGKNAKIKPKKKQETASKEKAQAPPEEESESGCVWGRRTGQRPLRDVQRSGREGWFWGHRGRRGFWHASMRGMCT